MVHYFSRAMRAGVLIATWFVGLSAGVQASVVGRVVQAGPARATAAPTLRLAMPDSSPTVDPALVANEESMQLAGLLYVGLVSLDSAYNVVPAAAWRVLVSPDRTVYTFLLRKELRFSNGDPITAGDFAFSINRSLNPALKSPSATTYLLDIKGAPAVFAGKSKTATGIKVIDPYTLRITARWPVPYFLTELTYPTSFALDKKSITKVGSVDSSTWYSDPVCSGPYHIKSWVPGNKMVLAPNKFFRNPRSPLSQLVISLAPLPSTDVFPYVTHNLDVVSLPPGDPSITSQAAVARTDALALNGIYMKFTAKPFESRQARQALSLALNRQHIVQQALGNSATPVQGFVPAHPGSAANRTRSLPFDPHRALQLWDASKYRKRADLHLTLYFVDDPQMAKLAKAITKSWRQYLHLTVATQGLTFSTLLTRIEASSLGLYLSGWSADYPDPHDWLSLQWESNALNNNVRYHNPAFDKLAETADVTWNTQRRQSLYRRAEQTLVDDAAWIPLYIPHRAAYIRPTVSNLVLTGYGLMPRSGNWATIGIRLARASVHRTT